MPLPLSGAMTFNDLNVELGFSGTAQISMGDAAVRDLFDIASGEIGMSNGYGKSAVSAFEHTITTNQQELNLRTYLLSVGWDGVEAVEVTINTGVYIWSDNRTIAALTTGSPYAGGLTLINEGFIMGKGGDGAYIPSSDRFSGYVEPTTGGPALVLDVPIDINNASGYIGGGGGGGAASPQSVHLLLGTIPITSLGTGGGGAGGGRGGPVNFGVNTNTGTVLSAFGEGGAVGQNGSTAINGIRNWPSYNLATHGGGGGASGVAAQDSNGVPL